MQKKSAQYVSEIDQQCYNYSTKCFFQDEDTKLFIPCQNEDMSVYKCKKNTTIVIFDYLLGDIYNCISQSLLVQNCIKFSDYKTCLECEQNYQYNSQNNTCEQHMCINGQYFDLSSGNCKNCGDNCEQCTQETCIKCINQTYVIDQVNPRSCQLCSLQNCQLCNIDGTCDQCQNNYFLDDTHANCVSCLAQGCQKCSIDGPYVCQTCIQNYILFEDTKQCLCSVKDCNTCDSNNGAICYECSQNFKLNSLFQCKLQCAQNNCLKCYDDNNQKCQQCKSNYSLSSSFQCTAICNVINCLQCNTDNGGICEQCATNYQLNSQMQCDIKCNAQNCDRCKSNNSSVCEICSQNYSLNDQYICIRNCQVSNCKVCNEDGTVCHLCEINYQLISNLCISQCDIQNCKTCEDNNSKICNVCKDSYYLDQLNQTCGQCQVENCKQCIWNSQKQCQNCINDYTKDKTNTKCTQFISTTYNMISFKQNVKSNGYQVQLEFSQALKLDPQDQFSNEVNIQISNLQNTNIQSTLLDNKSVVSITIQLNSNSKDQQLVIEFKDEYFQKQNSFKNKQYNYNLETFVAVTASQQEASKQAGSINDKVSQSFLMSIIPVIIFGNYYILINTIDITSFIYYLLYINVRYPSNVLQFCSRFKNFQFPFIPNIFLYIIDPHYVIPSPKKFMENDADCYFLKNGGQSLTICIGILSLYFLTKILSKFTPWLRLKQYFIRKIDETWEYSAMFDLVGTVYIYILVGVLLQFYKFDTSDPKKSSYLNYILFAFSLIFVIFYPIFLIRLIRSTKNISSNTYFQKKFSSLIGGLKIYDDGALKKHQYTSKGKINFKNFFSVLEYKRKMFEIQLSGYCIGIGYIRKFIFCFVIVFFTNFPPIQLIMIIFISLAMSLYYFYVRPYEKIFDNIKNGICELLLIGFEVCLMYLIDDQPDQKEEVRLNVGWIIILFCSLMIGIHAITMVIELFKIFSLILTRFVFGICILQFKKLHKSQIYRDKNKNTEINSVINPIKEQGRQDSSKKQDEMKDTHNYNKQFNQKRSQINQNETSFQDSPQLYYTQSQNNQRQPSNQLKDDTLYKNYTDYKGSIFSPVDQPEVSTFFKSKRIQGSNFSSSNFHENSLFSSMHQDKISDTFKNNTKKGNGFFKKEGQIASNLIQLDKKQIKNNLI